MFHTLSTGIYTIPDAARILGLPLSKLRRWLKDSEAGMVEDATARRRAKTRGRTQKIKI